MFRRRRNVASDTDGDDSHQTDDTTIAQRHEAAAPLKELRKILSSSYVNILLIFLPFAIASGALSWSSPVIFITNFFSLIALAWLLSYSSRQLSRTIGTTAGGLVTITFGNVLELIVGVVALRDSQITLIQTAMLGSILSSYLFVRDSVLTVFTN
jgi:Ca2+/H+ antiporter